jgi:hypothetical protein
MTDRQPSRPDLAPLRLKIPKVLVGAAATAKGTQQRRTSAQISRGACSKRVPKTIIFGGGDDH